MKIAIFTDTYKPHINGVSISTDILFTELQKLGHQVELFCPRYPGQAKDSAKNIHRLASFPFPFYPGHRSTWGFFGVDKKIKAFLPDIIHSQTPFFVGFKAKALADKYKVPMIHTYHTVFQSYLHYMPILPEKIAMDIAVRLSRWYCNACPIVFSPSQGMKDILLGYNVTSKIIVLPTGIEFDLFNSAMPDLVRKKFNIPDSCKVLLYAGRVGAEKGIDFVIKSFKLVLKEYKDVKLVIVGDGPGKADLENLVKQTGLDKDVFFAGAYQRPDVAKAMKDSDIFLFASKTETQGLVIVEAHAAGLPTVSRKAMGVEDVVEDGVSGFLTADDLNEYAQKVLLLLRDAELRKKLSSQAVMAAKDLSASNFGIKSAEYYKEAIEIYKGKNRK